MNTKFLAMPISEVSVEAQNSRGSFDWWRQALGHGGINAVPLPPTVIRGIRKLQPRLIRIFISEFFDVYPDHGIFNWSILDPYMDALAQTGAKIVASINIKPKALFPVIDHTIWQPSDVAEWQNVIYEMVKRYSTDKPIVTYWEVGNETDIGEWGADPFLIKDPKDYIVFYETMLKPILQAYPEAQVGGPACCWAENEPLPGLVKYCRETGTRLDFISWHCYNSDVEHHLDGIEKAKALLEDWPGKRPEMLYTEWNKDFEIAHGVQNKRMHKLGRNVSVDDMAFEPRRAAIVAAAVMAMSETELDWSFYYHIWDQVFYPETFRRYFSEPGLAMMMEHWNETPHRFGMFGVNGEVRPTYFVYQLFQRLGSEKLPARATHPDVRVLAARSDGSISVMLVNYNTSRTQDQIVQINFENLKPGGMRLTVYRIDEQRRWSEDTLELEPVECRDVYVMSDYCFQVYLPEDCVVVARLEEVPLPPAVMR